MSFLCFRDQFFWTSGFCLHVVFVFAARGVSSTLCGPSIELVVSALRYYEYSYQALKMTPGHAPVNLRFDVGNKTSKNNAAACIKPASVVVG